jgi:hypothetical protein
MTQGHGRTVAAQCLHGLKVRKNVPYLFYLLDARVKEIPLADMPTSFSAKVNFATLGLGSGNHGQAIRRGRGRDVRVQAWPDEDDALAVMVPGNDTPLIPTHWSFGQLCSLVGAPAGYLRNLPETLTGINLQYGLSRHRGEQIKTLEMDDGRVELRAVTGAELYALVWSKPVSKLAPDYGLSDVGLRKICVKHDVPTPPPGYWAKLAHGKKVRQTPLPALRHGISDHIHLPKRHRAVIAAEIVAAQSDAVAREAAIENRIVVPTEKPTKLHPFARATEIALNKSNRITKALNRAAVPA